MEYFPSRQQFGINTALSGSEDSNILLACTKCNLFIEVNPQKYISLSHWPSFAFMPVSPLLMKHSGKMQPIPNKQNPTI